jgi:uncharacterized OB-fold protein
MTMDVRQPDGEWQRPTPAPAEFWEAAASGRLLVQRCEACGHRQFYPRAWCTECGADPTWEEVSGRGTVHTYTVIRQQGAKPFRNEIPYVVAMIELEEGPRMMGNITGCPVEDVAIGMAVRAYAVVAEPGVGVPFWEPA